MTMPGMQMSCEIRSDNRLRMRVGVSIQCNTIWMGWASTSLGNAEQSCEASLAASSNSGRNSPGFKIRPSFSRGSNPPRSVTLI